MSSGQAQVAWWREPTRGQWAGFLAVWVGWILDAFDFTIFVLVMPTIAREFGVSMTAVSVSITLTLLLRLAGGVVAGTVADRWGRKLPLMLSVLWFALCDGAVAFAPSFTWVLVLRTLFGFGMGAEWTSGSTLVMENWPERSRGLVSGVLQGSWGVGYILAATVSAWVVPVWGWRALFLLAALPALLVLPIRFWVPESPAYEQVRAERPRVSWHTLVEEGLLVRLVWACLLMGAAFAVYNGLAHLYPTLLQQELGQELGGVARLVSVFNVGMMVGAVVCGAAASRFGVLPALLVPILVLLPFLPLYVGQVPGLMWLGALVAGLLGAGISGVTPLWLTLLFPAHVRARCVGLVYHVGAGLAAFVPPLVAALSEKGGMRLSHAMMGVVAVSVALMVVALFLRPRGALR